MDNTTNKKSLKDVIGSIMDTPESEELTMSMPDNELEKTDWFKSLSQNQKDKFRAGDILDPEMKELDMAVSKSEQEILDDINQDLASKDKNAISMEDLKSDDYTIEPDRDSEDSELSFRKQLSENSEVEEEPEVSLEENKKNDLREFERSLRESVLVEFDVATDNIITAGNKSAALNVSIIKNTEYSDTIKSVLDINNIKFKTSKKGKLKNALLRNYIQRNPHVTTPLVNSGIFITLSGASVPEIIHINSLEGKKRSEIEIKKMSLIQKHLVDTSLGSKISLTQLLKIIYYKDIQTLWFNIFIGTFPPVNEFPVNCENPKCKAELKLQIHAADLVLNAEDFEKPINDILYHNTDILDVIKQSELAREKRVLMNDHTIIVFKDPSIYDLIYLTTKLEELQSKKDLSQYQNIVELLMFIAYAALPDTDGEYNKFDSIDDILEIILLMSETDRISLGEHVEDYTQKNIVKYGLKSYTCPKCNKVHAEKELDMSDLIFTFSRIRWAMVELQRLRESETNG